MADWRLWQVGAQEVQVLEHTSDHVRTLAFSPDGKRLAYVLSDRGRRETRVWCLASKEPPVVLKLPADGLAATGKRAQRSVTTVTFLDDGAHLACRR